MTDKVLYTTKPCEQGWINRTDLGSAVQLPALYCFVHYRHPPVEPQVLGSQKHWAAQNLSLNYFTSVSVLMTILTISNHLFPITSNILKEAPNFHFYINTFHRQHCCDIYYRSPDFCWQRQGKTTNCKYNVRKLWAMHAICLEQTGGTLGIQ